MKILGLYAGKPQPFGPRKAPSSIIKSAVPMLTVHKHGTLEDEQGNKKLHGGPEKVLHQYAMENYEVLKAHYPEGHFPPGSIGENLLVEGMHDGNVCIGDRYLFGEVILQVNAPRSPCNKISHRYGIANLDRFVSQQQITGWYYRVEQEGKIHQHSSVSLLSRVDNATTIKEMIACLFVTKDKAMASSLADHDGLDPEWREKLLRLAHASRQSQ
ncbi:MOSC domain-containing protein [Alteromonas ponticola]|uniref:MOSC domain-containing protein n=1 Tax=Alteromonas ponticola TaxID=2720613 RepID=A0ABX1R6P9_9ALTE|nr:MOSC domain-containing protein [Alteromonas ponticola]NMH60898.1 MOSC domain-containing protein [Alteromonas ponticola]